MQDTLHIRINSPYALAIIENLEKMHAVYFLAGDDDDIEIPGALNEETRRRLELLKQNPQTGVSMDGFKKHIQNRLSK